MSNLLNEILQCSSLLPDHEDSLWSPRTSNDVQNTTSVIKKNVCEYKKLLFSDIMKKFSRGRVHCDATTKQVFVYMMNQRRCVAVDTTWTLDTLVSTLEIAFGEMPEMYYITLNSKPIRPFIPLGEFGLQEGSNLIINECLFGGSPLIVDKKILLPTYNHVLQCEKLVLNEMSLQSGNYDDFKNFEVMYTYVMKCADKFMHISQRDWIIEQVENIALTCHYANKCSDINDYFRLIQMSYRLFTGKVFSVTVADHFQKMFDSEVQSSGFETVLKTLRNVFDFAAQVEDIPLVRKLKSLFSFALTQGFLQKFGLTLSDEEYSKIEQRAMLNAYSSKKAFFVCVLDTSLFICEKLYEWRQTGDVTVMIQSGDIHGKWLKEADRILNLAPFVGNLEAHNTSYFTYLSDLRDAIEKGESYAKYTKNMAGVESKFIQSKLNSLRMLQNTEITRKSAQQERKAPMGVLIHGSSSIAKSSFTKILFNYYGGLFNLDRGDHYRYVRNPLDQYWTNYHSSVWCIQLDDVAFLNPTKTSSVDPTTAEVIMIGNNVPLTPPQAALEDKGKTPVLARLLLATTNCVSLNAQEYFWCPLAVRRRLPYVITVKPKQEYLHTNGKFIDPLKLECVDGEFPDFWEITVSSIQPTFEGGREHAKLKEECIFTDINEFLQHFGRACLQHEANQEKAMAKDKDMISIQICKECLKPMPRCSCVQLQYGVQNLWDYIPVFFTFTWWFEFWVNTLVQYRYFNFLLECLVKYRLARNIAMRIVNGYGNTTTYVRLVNAMGAQTQSPKIKNLLVCGAILGGALSVYCAVQGKIKSKPNDKKKEKKEKNEAKHEVQGNVFGTTEDQLEKETRNNVWYNPNVELTTFDVPKASTSLVGISADEVRDLFDKNCVLLKIRAEEGSKTRLMRGVFIKGHMCLTNGHAFEDKDANYTVEICQKSVLSLLSSNIKIRLSAKDIAFSNNSDICLFEVTSLPPFKDVTKFWSDKDIFPTSGVELIRELDGTLIKKNLFALKFFPAMPVPELNNEFDVYFGVTNEETEKGQCGSLCVAITPRGPIVFGIHILGKSKTIGILKITKDEIDSLLNNKVLNQRPIVQGGTAPMLDCAAKKNILVEPHFKSLFRYLEQGSLNMYGSFAGFRPRPRSSVQSTPLQKEFLVHYNTEVGYGKPCMDGWAPWRNNIVEMVRPDVRYEKHILKECVAAYVEDILTGLPKGWEKELVILSNKAAVNGLPGVMYIDRIACSTSMGFPWACTKKAYLHDAKDEKYPEGVDFDSEVWDRVALIEEKYDKGYRAFPVFTGHLKDEATPLRKCKIKKTRMFSSAPADWSLVVRKRLLSFVRLLQKNKFVFEAGPGTVAQSSEWGLIRDYLTEFGENQIVAGDYGKFDKRMIADFILAAFEIIMQIHRVAGFSERECRAIMCIGEDTAFPLSNVNGDLVEFFGTNPSGHPLTVIINSLVNSLYMRYCYRKLNPQGEVRSFKRNVHLFTYGDDNIMGVNPKTSWFNHTDIQNQLAGIGVEYTMADKESESVPFVHIDDVSFLKRKWRWNEDVQNWVCPLEEESIIKSLTVWVPSKTIDCYAQMVAVISSANSEYFFYGREIFNEKHLFFSQLLEREPYKFYVNESTLPTYDQLVERFNKASEAL